MPGTDIRKTTSCRRQCFDYFATALCGSCFTSSDERACPTPKSMLHTKDHERFGMLHERISSIAERACPTQKIAKQSGDMAWMNGCIDPEANTHKYLKLKFLELGKPARRCYRSMSYLCNLLCATLFELGEPARRCCCSMF